eukprot:gnl/TRDRNA2_/TRDRNA2_42044_c0_seq1.p1 gnl/TRDRNA2_/TRDRNA2_42044_c0~~gnl/TRDRNA2_/TRDRNA2_42044_c0_seq1.p1  ORF type:complete len:177 (+),score=37.78 gnl/TRDRNA2_/TRDRNA2_42044_c0_seq1:53-583(+)
MHEAMRRFNVIILLLLVRQQQARDTASPDSVLVDRALRTWSLPVVDLDRTILEKTVAGVQRLPSALQAQRLPVGVHAPTQWLGPRVLPSRRVSASSADSDPQQDGDDEGAPKKKSMLIIPGDEDWDEASEEVIPDSNIEWDKKFGGKAFPPNFFNDPSMQNNPPPTRVPPPKPSSE